MACALRSMGPEQFTTDAKARRWGQTAAGCEDRLTRVGRCDVLDEGERAHAERPGQDGKSRPNSRRKKWSTSARFGVFCWRRVHLSRREE